MVLLIQLSDVGCTSDPLDVCDDISSRIEQVKVNNLVSDVRCHNDSLDVCNEINCCIEKIKVESPIDLADDNVLCTVDNTVSLERRQCSQRTAARRDASASPCGDGSEQLHTLVNGVTGVVDGKACGTSIIGCFVKAR